jgi:hypothetical protein
MYVASGDRSKWKRRSKGNVLGRMHEHKREAWLLHIDQCEQAEQSGYDPAAELFDDYLEEIPF